MKVVSQRTPVKAASPQSSYYVRYHKSEMMLRRKKMPTMRPSVESWNRSFRTGIRSPLPQRRVFIMGELGINVEIRVRRN